LLKASAKEDLWIVKTADNLPAYREQVLIKVSYKPEILLGAYYNVDGWLGDGGHIYNITHWQPLPFSFDEYLMNLAIEAALDAMPKQEPVAYRIFNTGGGGYESPYIYMDADDLEGYSEQYTRQAEALYTNPQLQQNPLSEDEIFELFSKQNFTAYKIDDGTDHNELVAVDRAFIDFARSIERAHGVGT
jgi:hypothetical protein